MYCISYKVYISYKVCLSSIERVKFKRLISLKSGGLLVLVLEVHEISPEKSGLFLDKYKLSWICFSIDNTDRYVLVDAHAPDGLHYHLNKEGPRVSFEALNLREALTFFENLIIDHFGDLEERLHDEDIHI